jgi:membrane protein DedA with SNARE-associated domain/rhodanese-related sulfurtransferase
MTDLLARYGLVLVFANVLVEQLGLPVPAVPTLIFSAARSADGQISAAAIFAVALLAALAGDAAWYVAGRLQGHRIMKLLCRVSLSPDSCVRQSEHHFRRWGRFTLLVAKFIPGVSTIAPPLAGAMRIPWTSFLLYDAAGAGIWAGAAIVLGIVFHTQADALLAMLTDLGVLGMEVLAALFAGYIGVKWFERRRFFRQLRTARITATELRGLFDGGKGPVVVDLRSAAARAEDGRSIPGSITMDYEELKMESPPLPRDREVIFYCNCPNDAGAAYAARKLIDLGYTRVRPLDGGLDAWVDAGYDVELPGLSPPVAEAASVAAS